jgi:hypothetical protein
MSAMAKRTFKMSATGRKEGRRQEGRCEGGQAAQDGAEVRRLAKAALLASGNPQRNIRADDQLHETHFSAWVRQPANCPANACKRDAASCVPDHQVISP